MGGRWVRSVTWAGAVVVVTLLALIVAGIYLGRNEG